MGIPFLSISEFVKGTQDGSISILEYASKICGEIEKKNGKFAHFNNFDREYVLGQAGTLEKEAKKGRKGKLLGIPISVKDCLCVKGVESRAGSKILSGYRPVFDATAVAKARQEGAIILGKTSQDEFGFGTFSVNHTAETMMEGKPRGVNPPRNPFDEGRSCGGSSGGAAGFTALTGCTHAAIAESTGGSIACPAAFCGVASITPTYGKVSRYGLMDYANSLDKIGTMGKTIEDAALLLNTISGKDEKDSTAMETGEARIGKAGKMKIGIPKELMESIENRKLNSIVMGRIKKAESFGAEISEVKMPLNTKYGIAAYYIIAMSEASTNLAKYCGMRYGLEKKLEGSFNEYFTSVRSEAFGEEAKRRILLGTFARMSGFRNAYYLKAMKARTMLIREYRETFSKVDLIAHPAMPVAAPKFSEIEKLAPIEHYAADLCTVPANLCGMPHATINAGFLKEMPVGLMIVGDHLQENGVLSLASALEAGK